MIRNLTRFFIKISADLYSIIPVAETESIDYTASISDLLQDRAKPTAPSGIVREDTAVSRTSDSFRGCWCVAFIEPLKTLFLGPVQEGDNLPSGADFIRAECTVSGSGGDSLCGYPSDSLSIVRIAGNIRKVAFASNGRRSGIPIEERGKLASGHRFFGMEGCSGDDAALCRPQRGLVVIGVFCDVRERIFLALWCGRFL